MSITRQNLSVIIVSYKSEHVIENCINSIDSTIEIIVIDNMSTDETIPIVKTFQHDPTLSDSKGYTSTKVIQIED